MILGVNTPHEVSFNFDKVDYYGEGELGVPFEASVECEVNYAIFKSDYFSLSEEKMKDISIGERNEHYFDADENYVVDVQGVLSLKLHAEMLKEDKISDDEIRDTMKAADSDLEIDEVEIAEEEY